MRRVVLFAVVRVVGGVCLFGGRRLDKERVRMRVTRSEGTTSVGGG